MSENKSKNNKINRRNFLKMLGMAGAAAGAGVILPKNVLPESTKRTLFAKAESGKVGTQSAEVHPGEYDAYYGIWSGGHSGEIRIVGVPSMREIKRIPVFNMECGSGWGYTNESKKIMGGYTVGDTHHVHGSYVNGTYDGRYVFVNCKTTNRLARIRLDYMECDAILKIPNIQGMHGTFPQRHPKTEWLITNSEFQVPFPNNPKASPKEYRGAHTIIDTERMQVICQLMLNSNVDLAGTDYQGKYSFATSYNTEQGVTVSEMLANDYDYLHVFHWERIREALRKGKYTTINGVKVIDARDENSDLLLRIPIPKNPHGVNITPDGKYAVCSGKVSPTCSVVEIAKIDLAFAGKIKPAECVVGQPDVGLGPLHTTFDGRGNAITSCFIDSTNVKWNVERAAKGEKKPIVDVLDIHYQVGHIMATMAETKEADGKWLVSLNKMSKDRFLNTGPLKPENEQLIDLTGEKLRLVHDGPAYIEPHDVIMVRKDILESKVKDRYNMFEHPLAVTKSGVERKGNDVIVRLTANAPMYGMQSVTVKKGNRVTFIVTNHDEISDLTHGFAIENHNVSFVVSPFQTKSATLIAENPGVYWIYCTNFCHALHLEMRMRFIVEEA